MQMSRAQRLQQQFKDKECAHLSLSKEYMLGAQTGDYVCTGCGETFTPGEAAALRGGRSESKPMVGGIGVKPIGR